MVLMKFPSILKQKASKSLSKTKVALHDKKIDRWIMIKYKNPLMPPKKEALPDSSTTHVFGQPNCEARNWAAFEKVCDVTSYVGNTAVLMPS
ncbi:hypothetical protein PTKIN_Ptkin03bG0196400 [Pterospermum kingtungense]